MDLEDFKETDNGDTMELYNSLEGLLLNAWLDNTEDLEILKKEESLTNDEHVTRVVKFWELDNITNLLASKDIKVEDVQEFINHFHRKLIGGALHGNYGDEVINKRAKNLFSNQGFKNKDSVKNLLALGVYLAHLVYDRLRKIEDELDKGTSWEEILSTIVCTDDPPGSWAFMEAVRSRYKDADTPEKVGGSRYKDADTPEKVGELLKLSPEGISYLADTVMTFDKTERYNFRLERLFRSGGTYPQALEIDPQEFNLPLEWTDPLTGKLFNRDLMIRKTICSVNSLDDRQVSSPSNVDLSKKLNAPLEVILESQNYWSNLYGDAGLKT